MSSGIPYSVLDVEMVSDGLYRIFELQTPDFGSLLTITGLFPLTLLLTPFYHPSLRKSPCPIYYVLSDMRELGLWWCSDITIHLHHPRYPLHSSVRRIHLFLANEVIPSYLTLGRTGQVSYRRRTCIEGTTTDTAMGVADR